MLELHVLLLPTTAQEFHDGPWMLREQLDFSLIVILICAFLLLPIEKENGDGIFL